MAGHLLSHNWYDGAHQGWGLVHGAGAGGVPNGDNTGHIRDIILQHQVVH